MRAQIETIKGAEVTHILSDLQVRTLRQGHAIAVVNDTDERILDEAIAGILTLLQAERISGGIDELEKLQTEGKARTTCTLE